MTNPNATFDPSPPPTSDQPPVRFTPTSPDDIYDDDRLPPSGSTTDTQPGPSNSYNTTMQTPAAANAPDVLRARRRQRRTVGEMHDADVGLANSLQDEVIFHYLCIFISWL